jgi:uncharacterized membrane protein HdeD (DUF308 family)
MKNETALPSHLPLTAIERLHRKWWLFLALGLVLIVLGTIGILSSWLFTLATVVFFGWLLVIAGAGVVAHAFWANQWSGFFLQLLSGVLYLVAGWVLAARPGIGAITLTLVIAISLVVQGAFRIGAALSRRGDGWGALLLSGIITLVLGLMIWNEWPLSGLWVIGLFVGIDMLFYGWWLVTLALTARRLATSGSDKR